MTEHRSKKSLLQNRLLGGVVAASFLLGVILMCINLYGLTQSIRKPGLGLDNPKELRFVPKEVWSYERSMRAIAALSSVEDKQEAVKQAVGLVNQSLVHPDWNRVDPVEYRQLIPVWENYFLHLIGRFSGLPQFERYHYADYKRSIRRGIGLCGDASIVLSSVLDNLGIENQIISFRGHVIVEYKDVDGTWRLADPDFGVLIEPDIHQLKADAEEVRADYRQAGYSDDEIDSLIKSYRSPYSVFESVYDFMAMRFIFEYASYVLKWLLPALLMLLGLLFWYLRKRSAISK